MLKNLATRLWGNFEPGELQKFGLLSLIFGLIIGTYWAMRPIKDSIFNAIVGGDYLPYAKILSLCVVFPLVIFYTKLVDMFPRQKVFYMLICFYAILTILFTICFMHPEIGLANTVKSPSRVIGWAWYVMVESFGSLIVALFWAITTDTTDPKSAARGFPIISLFGQIGNIFGPLILNTRFLGLSNSGPIVGILSCLMISIGLLFWTFNRVTPKSQLMGYRAEEAHQESEPGFFEGLKLLVSKGYLLGIFFILFLYEIIVTIFDNHFKQTVFETFTTEADVQSYLSQYAWMTGVLATVCVLLGVSNIQRRLGMVASLITLPLLVTVAVFVLKFNPFSLSIVFWIMVISKAVNYALNAPTTKQLYIPTTKDAKYKSQAWIEMFGSRSSKGVASYINTFRGALKTQYGALAGIPWFLTVSSSLSLVLIVAWLFIALYVGRTYNKAVAEDRVVC